MDPRELIVGSVVGRDPAVARTGFLPPFAIYLLSAVCIGFLSPRTQIDPVLLIVDIFASLALLGGCFFGSRRAARLPLRAVLVAAVGLMIIRVVGLGLLKLLRPDLPLAPLSQGALAVTAGVFLLLAVVGAIAGRFSGTMAVFANETTATFRSRSTYYILAAFSGLAGISTIGLRADTLSDVMARLGPLMLFGAPMFALRYASVLQGQTSDPYHGAPVRAGAVLIGRYAATLLPALVLLAAALPAPLAMASSGDIGLIPLATAFLGLALLTAAATAAGFFAAAVSSSPVAAAGAIVAGAFLCTTLAGHAELMDVGWARRAVEWLSATDPLRSFGRGVIELRFVAYYVGVAIVALFWTRRWAEARRWQ